MSDILFMILTCKDKATTLKWKNMSRRCCAHHLVLGSVYRK